MTPKEKAEDLIITMKIDYTIPYIIAIECALIAIDEILKVASFYNDSQAEIVYWQEVKQEIKKNAIKR